MGRNAEAAGNLEYALKVYAYLVEHFGDIPEAMIARHGQQRIIAWQRAEMARRNGGSGREHPDNAAAARQMRHSGGHSGEQGDLQGTRQGTRQGDRQVQGPPALKVEAGRADRRPDADHQRPPPLSNRLEALRSALPPEPGLRELQARPIQPRGNGNPSAPTSGPTHQGPAPQGARVQYGAHGNQSHVQPTHFGQGGMGSRQAVTREHAGTSTGPASTGLVPAEPGLPRMIARAAGEGDEVIDHEPYRRYRVGSFLASFLAVIGWLAVLCGLIMLAAMLSGFGAGAVPSLGWPGGFGLSLGSEMGAVALFLGLLAVFVSQIAHAVFDQANASLAMLEIEQSRGDY